MPTVRMTPEICREIQTRRAAGASVAVMAEEYGVAETSIRRAITGERAGRVRGPNRKPFVGPKAPRKPKPRSTAPQQPRETPDRPPGTRKVQFNWAFAPDHPRNLRAGADRGLRWDAHRNAFVDVNDEAMLCLGVPPGAEPIPTYPGYRIDRKGKVWSCWVVVKRSNPQQGKWWRRVMGSEHGGKPGTPPYLRVTLVRDGERHHRRVHQLTLETFVGPCPYPEKLTRHLNGNPADNDLGNLTWGTKQENSDDMKRHGRTPCGVQHPNARLSEADVLEIWRLHNEGFRNHAIAARLSLSRSYVSHILVGRRWKHLTPPVPPCQ